MNENKFEIPPGILKILIKIQKETNFDEENPKLLEESKRSLLFNLNWFHNPRSRELIQNFFINNNKINYNSDYEKFLNYFRNICSLILVDDVNHKLSYEKVRKIFDLFIELSKFSISYYNIKLHISKPENEEYINRIRKTLQFFNKPYRSRKNFSFGFRFKEYNVNIKEEKIEIKSGGGHSFRPDNGDCLISAIFVFNDLDTVKHHNLYLAILPFDKLVKKKNNINSPGFYKSIRNFTFNDLKMNWDDISQDSLIFFNSLINSFQLINNSFFESTFNLNPTISKKIEKFNESNLKIDDFLVDSKKYQKLKRFEDKNFSFELKNFNIFVGKNNTGKTYALKTIFNNPTNYHFNLKNNQEHKYDKEISINKYYIPKLRYLDNSEGTFTNLMEMILKLFKSIYFLQNPDLLNYNLNADIREEESNYSSFIDPPKELKGVNLWNIPNFTEILEFFSTNFDDFDYIEELTESDQIFLWDSFPLFVIFKEIFENWKKKIRKFFPDIKIRDPQRIGKGANFIIKIKDKYIETNEEIRSWKDLGSGIQELLSLVFIIEYIRIAPNFDYSNFFKIVERYNYTEALSFSIKKKNLIKSLYIDEPEISLHPSLLVSFFEYLLNISDKIQIFIATQSSIFIDLTNLCEEIERNVKIYLMKKDEDKGYWHIKIRKSNIIEIYDELYNYDPLDTSFFLFKYKYDFFLNSDLCLEDFQMIRTLINNRYEMDPNYKNLLKLGTRDESFNHRLIQNAYFLSFKPKLVQLQNNTSENPKISKIVLFQLNKLSDSSRSNLKIMEKRLEKRKKKIRKTEIKKKMGIKRFLYLWKDCWDSKFYDRFVLTYSENQSLNRMKYIRRKLTEITEKDLIPYKTLILFPENSIPYDCLDYLLDFASEKRVLIIGGLEHKKIHDIHLILEKLSNHNKKRYKDPINYFDLKSTVPISNEIFINQAIIINANYYFSFQIKNIPVYKSSFNKNEGIPIIFEPSFRIFETALGKIAVFICKDFLVNYATIDRWMDICDINILTIPSFSDLVNPFRYKFEDIASKPKNREKLFIFANIAEYGGSGIYNFASRREYEPSEFPLFGKHEENYKICNLY